MPTCKTNHDLSIDIDIYIIRLYQIQSTFNKVKQIFYELTKKKRHKTLFTTSPTGSYSIPGYKKYLNTSFKENKYYGVLRQDPPGSSQGFWSK